MPIGPPTHSAMERVSSCDACKELSLAVVYVASLVSERRRSVLWPCLRLQLVPLFNAFAGQIKKSLEVIERKEKILECIAGRTKVCLGSKLIQRKMRMKVGDRGGFQCKMSMKGRRMA
jgi:hypothetical protein